MTLPSKVGESPGMVEGYGGDQDNRPRRQPDLSFAGFLETATN
jgi:hypothetical protein